VIKKYLFLFIVLLTSLTFSCKKGFLGNATENIAPETHCVIDTIIRVGENRLNSLVTINWWGDDADGLVKGYEFTFDSIVNSNTNWTYTTLLDSTFTLTIPAGFDTLDLQFYVRAIDNDNAEDPTPARLTLPIKNSAPTVSFLSGPNNPTKTFPVVKFYWSSNDLDGVENLNYYEICWNDTNTTLLQLDISANSITLEGIDLTSSITACNVYINNSLTALSTPLNGMLLNDSNTLYIRVIDKALKKSSFVASYKVFIKKPTSNILLVDGYGNAGNTVTAFYTSNLSSIGFNSVDTMQIFQTVNSEYSQLAPDNLTQSRIFKLFDFIIWYSNDATKSLSIGQKTLGDFFNQNGKLFLATYVSSSFDPLSTFLDYTPAQSLVSLPADTILLMNNIGDSLLATQSGYQNITTTSILPIVKPFNLSVGASGLYDAVLKAKKVSNGTFTPWTGISTVIAKKANGVGDTNFIFSTLELQKLNGSGNISSLFQKIMIDEFNQ
jgi:hypothetical protein